MRPLRPKAAPIARKIPAIITTTAATMMTGIIMDEKALFQLMSWLSPAFPVGAFSYSHGIEYAVETGLVIDEATLEGWTRTCLHQEFGNIGGAMLRAAYEAAAAGDVMRLSEALEEARAFVPTP